MKETYPFSTLPHTEDKADDTIYGFWIFEPSQLEQLGKMILSYVYLCLFSPFFFPVFKKDRIHRLNHKSSHYRKQRTRHQYHQYTRMMQYWRLRPNPFVLRISSEEKMPRTRRTRTRRHLVFQCSRSRIVQVRQFSMPCFVKLHHMQTQKS